MENKNILIENGIIQNELIPIWHMIGIMNPWISEAVDPEFDYDSFSECASFEELYDKVSRGNWCLGRAFYHKNICLINQINGGDEWMVIKDDVDFESFTVGAMTKEEFLYNMECIEKATLEQCKNLEYTP
jgi:hypothetical protein